MIKEPLNMIFHSVEEKTIISSLGIDRNNGLSSHEAAEKKKQYGLNKIAEEKRRSTFAIFLSQFNSPIVFILFFAAALSFGFKEWLDGAAILIVILINAMISFFMEYQAEHSMQALRKLSSVPSKVLRNNQLIEIDSEEIVPADIVFLEAGDLVPADGRILDLFQLQVDESALTGESIPIEKENTILPEETPLAERVNMLYKGTYITKGNTYLAICATGMQTELGKIAELVQTSDYSTTPLEKKLEQFSKKLIKVTVIFVVIIFIAGLLNGQQLIEMLETAIALAVAAIPEGLPIVATIALAQGMLKMAKFNVLVKKLSAVETLGETTVICTDKTGTLTQNKIEVEFVATPSGNWDKNSRNENTNENLRHIIHTSILCNTAILSGSETEKKEIGDPLEIALLKFSSNLGSDVPELRKKYKKLHEEPFSSETRLMATLHEYNNNQIVYAKGAVEAILNVCTGILGSNGVSVLNEEKKLHWLKEGEQLASSGLRVIAAAYKEDESKENNLLKDLVFTGLIGMIDPPRPEVYKAIEECKQAGINVIMITGDHPSTAKYIGTQLGIAEKDPKIIIGSKMKKYESLSEDDKTGWANTSIFARVNPGQKLDLVKVLQEKGNVVGMTGDGVNDAPALKQADIGIAMGQRGTQVAQEVADMVLKDDSFSSIVTSIKQGRIIFENIQKFVIFLLSCNLSELFVIAIASVFNMHFQLFPLQILFINLITDVLPALALSITEGNDSVMKQKPKHIDAPIIDPQRWRTIIFYSTVLALNCIGAVLFSHYIIHRSEPWNTELSNNILFFSLMFSQLLHVFNMGKTGTNFFRTEVFRNRYVWFAILICFILLISIYFIPSVAKALFVFPISGQDWLVTISSAIVTMIIIQIARTLKIIKQ